MRAYPATLYKSGGLPGSVVQNVHWVRLKHWKSRAV